MKLGKSGSVRLGICGAAIIIMANALQASAAITTLGYWRLGEADGGAVNGGTISSTSDSMGGLTLTATGTPSYTSNVSPAAVTSTFSSLGASFSGSTQYLRTTSLPTTAVDNFGLEAWVKPNTTSGNAALVYLGATNANGWGLYRIGSNYQTLFGGKTLFGATPATLGAWTHLAVVRDSGLSTFYVNGVAVSTSGTAPNTPTTGFAIATPPQIPGSEFLNGFVDEARIFTFTPGTFSTSDLLFNQVAQAPVPEPGTCTLLVIAGMGLLIVARVRNRALPAVAQ